MQNPRRPTHKKHTGFTLVEIMVGLVIGMLATAIILQVMSNFEAQKRVTTGTADAQTNGAIALFNIERELAQAGYPLMPRTTPALNCTTFNFTNPSVTSLNPVSITDGVSDSITVRYGDSFSGGATTTVNLVSGKDVTVENNMTCRPGDISLVVRNTNCALASVSAVPMAGATGSGVYRTLTLSDITNVTTDSKLACLGRWSEVTFAVVNGVLQRNGAPIMDGIVNMQAQYGLSAVANSNQIVQWVDATIGAAGNFATPSTADRNRIKAIRIAVVARNPRKETKDPATNTCNTTAACSSLSAANPGGLCAWDATSLNPSTASPAPAINLSADADWACYRYRVFETVIPLRNVIWSKGTL